jgi:HEAT repeat protein
MSAIAKTPHKKNDYLSELRSKYHSLDTDERFKSIHSLAQEKNSDSTRELIHVFNECGWRETKFQILKSIVANPDLRCLEFLCAQAQQVEDIPLAEAALQALGETKSIWAARFLSEFYKFAPESLKPACVSALGKLSDRRLLPEFLHDLDKAFKTQQTLLVKNLVLALGELKAQAAIPMLITIAKNKSFRDVALSAVVSLGKIAKDAEVFNDLESYFKNDSFEYQIFNAAKSQCQFRSDWKLEDYLNKIITHGAFHPALLLEFNAFPASDVKAALDMLAEDELSPMLFKILAKIEFPEVVSWYKEYSHLVNEKNQEDFLQSLSSHSKTDLLQVLEKYSDIKNKYFIKAHLLNSANPEPELKKFILSDDFKNVSEDEQIQILNDFYYYLLAYKPNEKLYNQCLKTLEAFTIDSKNLKPKSLGRMIRLFGQLNYSSPKLNQYVFSKHVDQRKSCLVYFESQAQSYFWSEASQSPVFTKNPDFEEDDINAVLKILISGKENPFNESKWSDFLKAAAQEKSESTQIWFLKLIAQFKPVAYKEHLLKLAKSPNYIVQFHVIIALKSFGDETLSDQISLFLNSKSKSISGRALDAMLSLPGNRAKRLVFEYFGENYNVPGVAEKIVRSFRPPENDTDYFSLQVAKMVSHLEQKEPDFQALPLLREFQDQLTVHQKSFSKTKSVPTDADILAIDHELEKVIPSYKHFDETSKSALRSAEVIFRHPELFDAFVDKSSVVLGYAKAIDIVLEKQLGRKILFPKLESKLNEFQNVVHSLTLNEDYPQGEKVLKLLQLEKHFSVQSLPVHKMGLVAKGIMNSKIISEHFKILDGLRAWSVMLLVFARKSTALTKPLITVVDDEQSCVLLAKKLMWLQDVRNPIAHRQTVVEHKDVEQIREEVFQILKLMHKILFC